MGKYCATIVNNGTLHMYDIDVTHQSQAIAYETKIAAGVPTRHVYQYLTAKSLVGQAGMSAHRMYLLFCKLLIL